MKAGAALLSLGLAIAAAPARADDYGPTLKTFRDAGQSSKFFGNSYGYAVFPSIGKGGVGIGGAQATAVAITAGAWAQAGTTGASSGASGTKNKAKTAGGYQGGMAVFTIAKGGLMYEATVGGQKFSYEAKK
jgi:hypothetical protein